MTRKILQITLVCLFFSFQSLRAQEEKFIGLFLYNFTKYFDWPAEVKTGDFVVYVLGHESVANELKQISSMKKVGIQNIVVRSISNPSEAGPCQIMFVGHWHSRYLPQVIDKLGKHSSLIVTEKEGLLQQGAAINFVIREGVIKFEMKKSNATSHGLKVDPRIAELALRVED
jgi:hypothetical protein